MASTFTEITGAAPDVMRDYDLATLGYEETEYCLEGTAVSYELKGDRGEDGQWQAVPGAEAPFRTRLVVRRPIEPARFSGVAVVEWHNVSGGIDAAPDWNFFHRHLCAQGHAWVGVSAQKVGIDGGGFMESIHLKLLAPERYGHLEHPGDAWSFDMFTQVGELLRRPAEENPLRGLTAQWVLAVGESQSAACLVTYINAIDPHTRVFDGYVVHGRPGTGVAIDGVFIPRASAGSGLEGTREVLAARGERIREDARVPVFVFQSETDLIVLGGEKARQPDGERTRTWEVAGAAHADSYTINAGRRDDGTLSGEALANLMRPTRSLLIGQTATPINSGPQQHYVSHAVLSGLVRWVTEGEAPAEAPRLELEEDGETYRLDERGNAKGGLRTPWVDAPVATLSGLGQTGESFAFLFGTTTPFDEAALATMYPGGRDEWLERFEASLDEAIARGWLLADDRAEIVETAAATCSFPLELAGG